MQLSFRHTCCSAADTQAALEFERALYIPAAQNIWIKNMSFFLLSSNDFFEDKNNSDPIIRHGDRTEALVSIRLTRVFNTIHYQSIWGTKYPVLHRKLQHKWRVLLLRVKWENDSLYIYMKFVELLIISSFTNIFWIILHIHSANRFWNSIIPSISQSFKWILSYKVYFSWIF